MTNENNNNYVKPNFKSDTFKQVLECIYKFTGLDFRNEEIELTKSKYPKFCEGVTLDSMWRISGANYNKLTDSQALLALQSELRVRFPELCGQRYANTDRNYVTVYIDTDTSKNAITVYPEGFPDNRITKAQAEIIAADPKAAADFCNNFGSRMGHYESDGRDAKLKALALIDSINYEPALVLLNLVGVNNLRLEHSPDFITIVPDNKVDFTGVIKGKTVKIDAKATKEIYFYSDNFATEFIAARNAGKFGGLHGADYALVIIKTTKEIVCVNLDNPSENWLAGYLEGVKFCV